MTVGEKLRKERLAQNLSLQQVAEKTHLSSATLSRIETNKQGLDLKVFLDLAKVLDVTPAELLEGDGKGEGKAGPSLPAMLVRLESRERLRFWRELALSTKSRKVSGTMRRAQIRSMAIEIEELLAQIEFMREEIEYLRRRLRNC